PTVVPILMLWDADGGRGIEVPIAEPDDPAPGTGINDVAFIAGGRAIAIHLVGTPKDSGPDGTGTLQFRDAETGRLLATLKLPVGDYRMAAVSPDGQTIALSFVNTNASGRSTQIALLSVGKDPVLRTFATAAGEVEQLAFRPDGTGMAGVVAPST